MYILENSHFEPPKMEVWKGNTFKNTIIFGTPLKIKIEPENEGLEDAFPFKYFKLFGDF